jgi:hypothetical protein
LKIIHERVGFANPFLYIHGIEINKNKKVMKKLIIAIAIIVTAVTVKVGYSEYKQWKQIKEQRYQVGLKLIDYTKKYTEAVNNEQGIHGLAASYGYSNLSCLKEATKSANDYQVLCNLSLKELNNYDTQLSQGFFRSIFNSFN